MKYLKNFNESFFKKLEEIKDQYEEDIEDALLNISDVFPVRKDDMYMNCFIFVYDVNVNSLDKFINELKSSTHRIKKMGGEFGVDFNWNNYIQQNDWQKNTEGLRSEQTRDNNFNLLPGNEIILNIEFLSDRNSNIEYLFIDIDIFQEKLKKMISLHNMKSVEINLFVW